jgi:chromosome partitioning protein
MPQRPWIIAAPEDAATAEQVRANLASAGFNPGLASAVTAAAGKMGLSQAAADASSAILIATAAAERSDLVLRAVQAATANAKPLAPVVLEPGGVGGALAAMLGPAERLDCPRGLDAGAMRELIDALENASKLARVVAMLNIKGGVGKTVLAANLFTALHVMGDRSICFVDLDPQHNLTQYFLSPSERNRLRESNRTLFAVFKANGPEAIARDKFDEMTTTLNRTPGRAAGRARLDLIPGDDRLFEFTLDAISSGDRDLAFGRFHAFITQLRARYDTVVIDTNPCATFLTRCAITASDHIAAPVRPEKYSLTGLTMLEWLAREIRGRPVRPAEFSVLLNGIGDRVRARAVDIDAQTREEIEGAAFFGQTLVRTAIPYSGLLRATPDDRYAPNPINVTAIMRLAQRGLKEALTGAGAEILARAGA